ncbi:MAG: hypothetical protein AB7G23_15870 [Vicinamibacterales bacterium]
MTPARGSADTRPGAPDLVRAHSGQAQNERIDARTRHDLARRAAQGPDAIGRRLAALDREWDIERYLQMNAGLVSLSGVLLGAFVNRRFLVLPAVVFGFFLQHAVQGWCPPLLVWRRVGVRTRREINREQYALRALRGDFDRGQSARFADSATSRLPEPPEP